MKRRNTDSRHKQNDQLFFFFEDAAPVAPATRVPAPDPLIPSHMPTLVSVPALSPSPSPLQSPAFSASASSGPAPSSTAPRKGFPSPSASSSPSSSGIQNQEIIYRRNERARRYILRVDRRGIVSVTIPRRGSLEAAQKFVASRAEWIQRQQLRRAEIRRSEDERRSSSVVLLRGREVPWSVEPSPRGWRVNLAQENVDLRQARQAAQRQSAPSAAPGDGTRADRAHLLRGLRMLAEAELPPRTEQLARQHGIRIARVTVRAQRSRWGSCSADGAISLNWRLIHAPPDVRDYLIIHELMHRRQMNHSAKYWREVEAACPDYKQAEKWLDNHSYLLDDQRDQRDAGPC